MNREVNTLKDWSIVLLTFITLLNCTALAKYYGGTGDPNDPYQIANVADLMTLANDANDYNKCFLMTADIDLDPCLPGNKVFTTAVIASDMNNKNRCVFDGKVFTGVFDGAGYKICNLTINTNGGVNDYLGLFGDVNGGEIKKLGLQNVSVTGGYDSNYIGGLAGYNSSCIIINCYSTGSIANGSHIGGLVGYNYHISINNCYSTVSIIGKSYLGGLVGYNNSVGINITDCYSTGSVAGKDLLGGLVGSNDGSISNCHSSGDVTGGIYSIDIGGLVGDNSANISNCYSTGNVNGATDLGGLAGSNHGSINNCYSTSNLSGGGGIGGLVGNNFSGSISNSYSTGAITGGSYSSSIGGLVGENWGNWMSGGSIISNSYSTGTVTSGTGSFYLGGLVGYTWGSSISNSYSTGTVTSGTGSSYLGGLVGYKSSGNISNSYFLDVAGPHNGLGTPLTDIQMKQQASFVGWDFINVWKIEEGVDYPKLGWSPKYTGGSGDSTDPYQIATASDLNDIGNHPEDFNKCFLMTADINLDPCLPGNQTFTTAVIACDSNDSNDFDGNTFAGVFDGAGHKIIKLTINTKGIRNNYLGLFGDINGGEVKNLGLQDVNISSGNGSMFIGGLVGNNRGIIRNCYSTGAVNGGNNSNRLGGLVGLNAGNINNCHSTETVNGGNNSAWLGGLTGCNYGNIDYCFSTGDVNGDNYLGGIAGLNCGNIRNSYSTGSISSEFSTDLGGLVGHNTGNINNCCATGNVTSNTTISWNLGGLVGYNYYGSISNSYSKGNVAGENDSWYIGGLVGLNQSGNIGSSYSTGTVMGGTVSTYVGGLVGNSYFDFDSNIRDSYFLDVAGPNNGYGTPLTDSQMKQQASFVGWDFVWETVNGPNDIWAICEGISYPKLAWQFIVGDSDNDKDVDFIDFAALGSKWMQTDSNLYCGGSDLTGDGFVDLKDLKAFVENWLQ